MCSHGLWCASGPAVVGSVPFTCIAEGVASQSVADWSVVRRVPSRSVDSWTISGVQSIQAARRVLAALAPVRPFRARIGPAALARTSVTRSYR